MGIGAESTATAEKSSPPSDRPRSQRHPRIPPAAPPGSATSTLAVVVVVVVALYFGQDVLIPLALSILISFALAPLAIRLRRWGLGRLPSVLLVVTLVLVVVAAFAGVITSQIASLTGNLYTYESTFRDKIRDLSQATASAGGLTRIRTVWNDLEHELQRAQATPAGQNKPPADKEVRKSQESQPIPVEVHEPPRTPAQVLSDFAGGLLRPLATAGIIAILVIFFLLEREDLRDRFIRLFGSSDVHRTTEAMTDAARRVSRYLLMQLLINIFYGVALGAGLWLIGVPHPVLWGLLAAVLRFIPYVGPAISAGLPVLLAIAVDPGWTMPLLAIGLYVVLEIFISNVLEPWLYGSSTGLSPVAILVAAVFWTTLWGSVGLLLATPLTVCLVVLGRHVTHLRFLEVLLGSEPVLPPELKFYQRLLADDPDEAMELIDDYVDTASLSELFENVMVPALAFADQDRLRGALGRERWTALAADVLEMVGDVRAAATTSGSAAAVREGAWYDRGLVLCAGARNGLDDAAATMLAYLLTDRGLDVRTLSHDAFARQRPAIDDRSGVTAVCLFSLHPDALGQARRLIGRVRERCSPGTEIVLVLWNGTRPADGWASVCRSTGADLVGTSLVGASSEIEEMLRRLGSPAAPMEIGAPAA